MNANAPVDYSSRYSFSHFCCRVKQGKRLSECGSASIKGNSRTNSKIRYYIIWRCLHLMFSTTNVSDKWNVRGFERMLSYEQYPEEKSRLWLSSFKKLISLHGGLLDVTTNIIVSISSRFRLLHLLSWEFDLSEILWRYTVILVSHLKYVQVGWSTRNYPHTGH